MPRPFRAFTAHSVMINDDVIILLQDEKCYVFMPSVLDLLDIMTKEDFARKVAETHPDLSVHFEEEQDLDLYVDNMLEFKF